MVLFKALLTGVAGTGVAAMRRRHALLAALNEEPPGGAGSAPESLTVGIAVPAYEETAFIGDLLTSVSHQTYPVRDLVVADSSDEGHEETVQIVESFGGRVVRTQVGNVSLARNDAARALATDVVVFTDADTILTHHYVEHAVAELQRGTKVTQGRTHHFETGPVIQFGSVIRAELILHKTLNGAGVVVERSTWEAVGGYDETFILANGDTHEDAQFGYDIQDMFGEEALHKIRDIVGANARRINELGLNQAHNVLAVREDGEMIDGVPRQLL